MAGNGKFVVFQVLCCGITCKWVLFPSIDVCSYWLTQISKIENRIVTACIVKTLKKVRWQWLPPEKPRQCPGLFGVISPVYQHIYCLLINFVLNFAEPVLFTRHCLGLASQCIKLSLVSVCVYLSIHFLVLNQYQWLFLHIFALDRQQRA